MNDSNPAMTEPPHSSSTNSIGRVVSILVSAALGLFLTDALISLVDDALILSLGVHVLGGIRGIVFFLAAMTALLIYLLSGVTPMMPKRIAFPMALFYPVAVLALTPVLIYHYDHLPSLIWFMSFCQLLFAVGLCYCAQGDFRFRWPFVPERLLDQRRFAWWNLCGFSLLNVCVFLPGVLLYLAFCASLAVDHFSGSFVALRADGLVMRAKTYVRDDGKTIQLIPMMHIGEAEFYDQISKSFPTNAIILLEGVTDNDNLLKHELTYQRMANSLGLTEQKTEFAPVRGRPRRADVDVADFSKGTIDFLNLVTLIHSQGLKSEVLKKLMQKSQDRLLTQRLWADLLTMRNDHLLKEIRSELPQSDILVVPWGAAHMRGLSEAIQKTGFQLSETREYTVVAFPGIRNRKVQSQAK